MFDVAKSIEDDRARAITPMGEASEGDFATEFLAMKMSVKVVDDLDAAIAHVNATSTGHFQRRRSIDLG